MSFISKKVDYNPDVSEYYGSGDMLFFAPITPKSSPPAVSCFLPAHFAKSAEAIRNFEVRSDDIWVISFPKTGTTWTIEMIWMLHNDLDYDCSNTVTLDKRYHFFDKQLMRDISVAHLVDSLVAIAAAASPRFIKTHLPTSLLPLQLWTVKPKIIYVTRNAKDTAISYYHYFRNCYGMKCQWDDFVEGFLESKVMWAPFHRHVLDFWHLRNEKNVMFITFEAMKADLLPILRRAARFLGKNYSDHEFTKLQSHLSFDAMRKNDKLNRVYHVNLAQAAIPKENVDKEFRKGEAGGFNAHMSPALIERFDKWNEDNLKGTGFQFEM